MITLPPEADAEAVARRAWAWLRQVQADRSLPTSALRTASSLTRDLRHSADIDVEALRAYLAERGCPLDTDVQALVRGHHLLWCIDRDGTARATMVFRCGGRT